MAIFSDLPLELRQQIYSHALTLDLRNLQSTFSSGFKPDIFRGESVRKEVEECIGGKRLVSAAQYDNLRQACGEFAVAPHVGLRSEEDALYVDVTRDDHGAKGVDKIARTMRELGLRKVILDLRRNNFPDCAHVNDFLRRFLRSVKCARMEVRELIVFLTAGGDVFGLSWFHSGTFLLEQGSRGWSERRNLALTSGLNADSRFLTYSEMYGKKTWRGLEETQG